MKIVFYFLQLCLFLSLGFLSGCSLFSPVPSINEKTYVINKEVFPPVKRRSHRTVFVTPMHAEELYSSSSMAYSTAAYRISYFVKNRWAIPPAQMLQNMLIQTLQKTHYFKWVDSTTMLAKYDYILSTDLIELKQVFFPHCSEVHLIVRAKLINANTNTLIAAKQFTVVKPTATRTPLGGVFAANHAAAVLMNQLAKFCLKYL